MRSSVARVALLGLIVAASARAQHEHPSAIPVELIVPFAPAPVNAEGQQHLVYELHVTNFGRAELVLERLDVLDGDRMAASYADDALGAILARPGLGASADDKRSIAPGLRAVAFVDVVAREGSPVPRGFRHRLTFAPLTPPNAPLQSVVEGGAVDVSRDEPPALGPPLAGSGWLALHGLSNESGHRRTLLALDGRARISQRFAVDWTRVAPDGQVFHGDPAKNENWAPYGAAVLAVADGRVVDVQDGIPENDPTSATRAVPITVTTVGGNSVVLDLGHGRYAFYAHLQPQSLCVRRGDAVRRGQVLAKLGNSGQADAPHLHLHIADAASPLAAEGTPMVFAAYTILGHVPSLKVLTDGTGWKPSEPPRRVTKEMPVENAVVAFPGARELGCPGSRS